MNTVRIGFITVLLIVAAISCSDDTTNAPESAQVSGVVHKAEDGTPLADADVIAERHSDGAELGRTRTDGAGAFVLRELPVVLMNIRVEAPGYDPVVFESLDPVRAPESLRNLTVTMAVAQDTGCCSGVFTLVVRDGQNVAVTGAKVQVRKGGKELEYAFTDANGRIVVDGLCAGEYSYRISKEGYKVAEGVFTIDENCSPVTKEATLETETQVCCDGELTVIVRDPQSQPVAGALVRVWKNGAIVKKVTTDATGTAVFTDLCAAAYGVDIMKDGWTEREFEFRINENCDPVSKEITMEQAACCSGVFTLVVRDGQNVAVTGAKVQVRKGGKELEYAFTDANGRIVVDGLCAGEYCYRISKEGYKVAEGVFTIDENCSPVTKEATLETN